MVEVWVDPGSGGTDELWGVDEERADTRESVDVVR